MRSAIYSGTVKHNRLLPSLHQFRYPISMFYISFNELEEINNKYWFLSVDKFNILSFKLKNYLSADSVKEKINLAGFHYDNDKISILTHLSYLGFCYNPVSFYYCYDSEGDILQFILAEINNTPWNERYVYVLKCQHNMEKYIFEFPKKFHISPFMKMNLDYVWKISKPDEHIHITMQNFESSVLQFKVNMNLKKFKITNYSIFRYVITYTLITYRILFRIYWQAFMLWLKKIPFYTHPEKSNE